MGIKDEHWKLISSHVPIPQKKDGLDKTLKGKRIDLIALHKNNRVKPATQMVDR